MGARGFRLGNSKEPVREHARAPEAARKQWRRVANVGLLVGGYGIGQGAIFAVQTWLFAQGKFDLLSAFGTHFSFLMLGIFVIDAGSTTTLARQVARLPADGSRTAIWRLFWDTAVVRLSTAVVVAAGALMVALLPISDPLSRTYLLASVPGLLIWSANAVGMLDGLKLSGLSGLTGAIAFATSAFALALTADASPETAGFVLGAAFSLGHAVTVLAQWIVLIRLGRGPRWSRPCREGVVRAARDGFALLLQFIPGQLILRAQLLLSATFLGTEATALFIYAKQIVVAMTMLVGFVTRVDFPALVERAAACEHLGLSAIFRSQVTSIVSAVTLALGTLLACLVALTVPQYGFSNAAHLLAAYSPSIVTISALLIMIQGMAAMADYAASAKIVAVSTVVGIAVSYAMIGPCGIYAFVIGEMSFHLLGSALMYLHLRRRAFAAAAKPVHHPA